MLAIPSKILGHAWNKDDDTLELLAKAFPQEHPLTKRTILSYVETVHDPFGIISPTMAEEKHIYREACDKQKGWNAEVSPTLKNQWLRWTKQLKDVRMHCFIHWRDRSSPLTSFRRCQHSSMLCSSCCGGRA